jgi:hypothetical protein
MDICRIQKIWMLKCLKVLNSCENICGIVTMVRKLGSCNPYLEQKSRKESILCDWLRTMLMQIFK